MGQLVFVSGQVGVDPATGTLPGPDIQSQTRQTIENIAAILADAGLTLGDVVKTTVFLADMNEFAAMNEVYAKYFVAPFPARSTVQVARLPRDVRLEIEVVAVID